KEGAPADIQGIGEMRADEFNRSYPCQRRFRASKLNPEGSAFIWHAVRADSSIHRVHKTLAECQAETCSFDGGLLGAEAIEWDKQAGKLLLGDSSAGILDQDAHGGRTGRAIGDRDPATR